MALRGGLFVDLMSVLETGLVAIENRVLPILSARPSTRTDTVALSRRFFPSRLDFAL